MLMAGLPLPSHLSAQRAMKSISSVQMTVQRNLATTRELDSRFETNKQRANESARACIEQQRAGEEVEQDKVRQVRAEQRSTFVLAEKKLQLITEAHDLVDRQISRLDTELEKVRRRG